MIKNKVIWTNVRSKNNITKERIEITPSNRFDPLTIEGSDKDIGNDELKLISPKSDENK